MQLIFNSLHTLIQHYTSSLTKNLLSVAFLLEVVSIHYKFIIPLEGCVTTNTNHSFRDLFGINCLTAA